MPQTWLVVQCFQCRGFQVDQEKKANKWLCKMCGEKQSLQRVFARSHSAKDCRLVVQSYNEARGAVEQEGVELALDAAAAGDSWEECGTQKEQWDVTGGGLEQAAQPQRWQAFQEDDDEAEEGWTVAAPERPAKQKRGGGAGQAGGSSKRQRQQPQQQEEDEQQPSWGAEACGSGVGWGDGGRQQVPLPAPPQQRNYQPLQQQPWQAGGVKQFPAVLKAPAASGWGSSGGPAPQQYHPQLVPRQPAAAPSKWGGYAAEDDW